MPAPRESTCDSIVKLGSCQPFGAHQISRSSGEKSRFGYPEGGNYPDDRDKLTASSRLKRPERFEVMIPFRPWPNGAEVNSHGLQPLAPPKSRPPPPFLPGPRRPTDRFPALPLIRAYRRPHPTRSILNDSPSPAVAKLPRRDEPQAAPGAGPVAPAAVPARPD